MAVAIVLAAAGPGAAQSPPQAPPPAQTQAPPVPDAARGADAARAGPAAPASDKEKAPHVEAPAVLVGPGLVRRGARVARRRAVASGSRDARQRDGRLRRQPDRRPRNGRRHRAHRHGQRHHGDARRHAQLLPGQQPALDPPRHHRHAHRLSWLSGSPGGRRHRELRRADKRRPRHHAGVHATRGLRTVLQHVFAGGGRRAAAAGHRPGRHRACGEPVRAPVLELQHLRSRSTGAGAAARGRRSATPTGCRSSPKTTTATARRRT